MLSCLHVVVKAEFSLLWNKMINVIQIQNNRNLHWKETPGLSNLSLEGGSFPTLEQVNRGLAELELENLQLKKTAQLHWVACSEVKIQI